MLCNIADLLVEVPEAGGMAPRLRDYTIEIPQKETRTPDIVIREEQYRRERWPGMSESNFIYMDSAWMFYPKLLQFDGLLLHASALELDGRAYLFSGPSGMGKSTHARLWQQLYPQAKIFNDDKPALRQIDGTWYAYGTPWCGKDGINFNRKAPIAAICFLKRAQTNEIRRLSPLEATAAILTQTTRRFTKAENMQKLLSVIERLVAKIPVYELKNRPEPQAAQLSHDVMCREVLR